MLENKFKETKHFNTRLVTQERRQIAPRWASDIENVQKIVRLQKETIDSDAVFGYIDPRNSTIVELNELFLAKTIDQKRKYNGQRGSSAKQWDDYEEFATPNILEKKGS